MSSNYPKADSCAPPAAVSWDWNRVVEFARERGHLLDLAESPERLPGGLANINLRVCLDGQPAVFRRPPEGPLPKGANDMAREHRVLTSLASAWPLAPRSLLFCEDANVAGAPFQILEFRSGITLRGDTLASLAPTAATGERLSELMTDTLVDLHGLDPAAVGLGSLGRPEGFVTRSAKGWIQRGNAVGAGGSAFGFLVGWLEHNVRDRVVEPVILHNDFKLDNLILAPDGSQVSAVLDWDMATRGDPLFDLATLLSYWTQPGDPDCMRRLAQMPTALPGFASRADVCQSYALKSGRSLDGFMPIRILAMFRLGVVFHQLHAQHGGHDPRYANFDSLAAELLEFAAATASDPHL